MASRDAVPAPKLRALLNQPRRDGDTAFSDAHRYTVHLLGQHVAAQIIWRAGERPHDGADLGMLVERSSTGLWKIDLRYEMYEPGNEHLEVRVPCPHTAGGCPDAYTAVKNAKTLIAVLDGNFDTFNEVTCYTHA